MAKHKPRNRRWPAKFYFALRGFREATRKQSSFLMHFVVTIAVVVVAIALNASLLDWSILLICVFSVIAAETFNSALERLAVAITDEHDENIGHALDMASGAVLVTAIGAAVVGTIVLGRLAASAIQTTI